MAIEIVKAAMLASKSLKLRYQRLLKGDDAADDVTTELLKCHLEEETIQRGMNGVSSGY